ncbi:hypothetical protein [Paraburkholderia lacunae]|uniref:Uncharacterized protein n=1 Tax=Paraburkholderia lacunae TaxID=2211104 RepID=A0A370NDD2_9BURK|nr:hypothetical protein [Paraburkholderia lacunae]RDK03610.1 hypothetical protein DLM46_05105 [Paraburkholderia lacunae]
MQRWISDFLLSAIVIASTDSHPHKTTRRLEVMKKHGLIMVCAGAALYGIVDTAITYVNNADGRRRPAEEAGRRG